MRTKEELTEDTGYCRFMMRDYALFYRRCIDPKANIKLEVRGRLGVEAILNAIRWRNAALAMERRNKL